MRFMVELIEGRVAQAALLIMVLLAIYLVSLIASRRKLKTRSIPGLEKVDPWIQRAAELKRTVFFTPGTGAVVSPDTLAALALLEYVAKHCVEHGARIIVANADFTVQQVTEEIVKKAYKNAGKLDEYRPDSVRYISGRQFAYAAGVMGLLRREKPAVNFFVGEFSAEALEISEAGRTEAIAQFGGTSAVEQLPFFMATCDETLLGEELYTVQGYLSDDPKATTELVGPDGGKIIAILIILVGAILATLGNEVLVNLLKL
jgi:hypothetical protein